MVTTTGPNFLILSEMPHQVLPNIIDMKIEIKFYVCKE